MWFCPECRRGFKRTNQSHECAPAMPLEDYLAGAPAWEPGIIAAITDHLSSVGPIHVEPVAVGVFFKASGSLIELRTMTRWSRLWIPLPVEVHDRRLIVRARSGGKVFHTIDLDDSNAVDDDIRSWMSMAYAAFG